MTIKRHFGAPYGNQNGTKLKDPLLRQKAYEAFCAHLSNGKSARSFVFECGEFTALGETIEEYIKNNPLEFPPIKRKAAINKGYAKWETICEESATGDNQQANTASLNMVMRNKFGWDKPEQQNNSVDSAIIDKFLDRLDVALGVSKKDSD